MSDIRLIALDLDGTVFNDQKEITPRTMAAIRAAIAKGVDVIPATGRTETGVPEEFLKMPGVHYALTSNGATVVELATGRHLVELPFEPEVAQAVYDRVAKSGGTMGIFVDGECYTDRYGANEGLDLYPPALRNYLKSTRILVEDIHAFFQAHPHGVEKFSIMYPDTASRDAAWQAVAKDCHVELTSSIPNNLEINAPGVTKGRGLAALADALGLDRSQVMACGDSGNDLAMIETAGLGVAMANATPDVLAAADYVTASNNEDGVAKAIEKFVLGLDV